MGVENPTIQPEEQPENSERESLAKVKEKVAMPHVEPIFKLLEKEFKGSENTINRETVENILYTILEENIANTGVYKSEKYEAAFPWSVMDTGNIAKRLYELYTGQEATGLQQEENPKVKKEFSFSNFINIGNGNQFTFIEEAFHQIIRDLPKAIEDIKAGKEPNKYEMYMVGSPTNELGEMSQKFLESLKENNTFKSYGELYAEFISSQMPQTDEERDRTKVLLYGLSMGGSFATEAATSLLKEGAVSQSNKEAKEKHLPFMSVRIDTPPGANRNSGGLKVPVGFALNGAIDMFTNPYSRSVTLDAVLTGDKKFLGSVREILAERGMNENMSPEQVDMKKKAISEALGNLQYGIPVSPNLKLTEIVGTHDPLMYSPDFVEKVKKQNEEHGSSLGKNIVSEREGEENMRVFGIKSAHTLPYFRPNELKRWLVAIRSIEGLKESSS